MRALSTSVIRLRIHIVVAVLASWKICWSILRIPHLKCNDALSHDLIGILNPLRERVECVLLVSADDGQIVTSRSSTEPVIVLTYTVT